MKNKTLSQTMSEYSRRRKSFKGATPVLKPCLECGYELSAIEYRKACPFCGFRNYTAANGRYGPPKPHKIKPQPKAAKPALPPKPPDPPPPDPTVNVHRQPQSAETGRFVRTVNVPAPDRETISAVLRNLKLPPQKRNQ